MFCFLLMCLSQIQHISQYFTIFHKFHNISQFHNYPKYEHLQCEDTSARALIRTASSDPQCALAKGHAKFSISQATKQKIKVEEKVILKAKNTNTQIMRPKNLKRFEQRHFPTFVTSNGIPLELSDSQGFFLITELHLLYPKSVSHFCFYCDCELGGLEMAPVWWP